MIPYKNWEIFGSVVFYFGVKFCCYAYDMFRRSNLTIIPEQSGIEDEPCEKWVPKKKHEVLKIKYKCLKKLFQIYDASLNAIDIPEPVEYVDDTKKKRRKRSHRTKTDACSGTVEESFWDITQSESSTQRDVSSGDVTLSEPEPCAGSVLDSKINQSGTTPIDKSKLEQKASKLDINPTNLDTNAIKLVESKLDSVKLTETNDSKVRLSEKAYSHTTYDLLQQPTQYLMVNERRKLTRFQCFVQRIFGIARPNESYAASDSLREKRKIRGLRCRRLTRAKKIKSESDLDKSPAILSFVKSVRNYYLMDKTSRRCPVPGCNIISCGIVNYNDHLNLRHFKDRNFICHYCHEGFQKEYENFIHENEHIGITKLGSNLTNLSNTPIPEQKRAYNNNTQTDPEGTIPDEKLKKIVSFFDKICQDEIITEIKKNQGSGIILTKNTEIDSCGASQDSSTKRVLSGLNVKKCQCESVNCSEVTPLLYGSPVACHVCGVLFQNRRQLSLHVDLEHKIQEQFPRSHSCAGFMTGRAFSGPRRDTREECRTYGCKPRVDLVSEDGRLNILTIASRVNQTPYSSVNPSLSTISTSEGSRQSKSTLACDPSANIVYCPSTESVKKSRESAAKKILSYRWEPGTKIIHV